MRTPIVLQRLRELAEMRGWAGRYAATARVPSARDFGPSAGQPARAPGRWSVHAGPDLRYEW